MPGDKAFWALAGREKRKARYSVDTYRQAITRACDEAKVQR
ncbi:MAG: hypothetical protein ACI93T_000790, partial [Porticoccaceae bacterium]